MANHSEDGDSELVDSLFGPGGIFDPAGNLNISSDTNVNVVNNHDQGDDRKRRSGGAGAAAFPFGNLPSSGAPSSSHRYITGNDNGASSVMPSSMFLPAYGEPQARTMSPNANALPPPLTPLTPNAILAGTSSVSSPLQVGHMHPLAHPLAAQSQLPVQVPSHLPAPPEFTPDFSASTPATSSLPFCPSNPPIVGSNGAAIPLFAANNNAAAAAAASLISSPGAGSSAVLPMQPHLSPVPVSPVPLSPVPVYGSRPMSISAATASAIPILTTTTKPTTMRPPPGFGVPPPGFDNAPPPPTPGMSVGQPLGMYVSAENTFEKQRQQQQQQQMQHDFSLPVEVAPVFDNRTSSTGSVQHKKDAQTHVASVMMPVPALIFSPSEEQNQLNTLAHVPVHTFTANSDDDHDLVNELGHFSSGSSLNSCSSEPILEKKFKNGKKSNKSETNKMSEKTKTVKLSEIPKADNGLGKNKKSSRIVPQQIRIEDKKPKREPMAKKKAATLQQSSSSKKPVALERQTKRTTAMNTKPVIVKSKGPPPGFQGLSLGTEKGTVSQLTSSGRNSSNDIKQGTTENKNSPSRIRTKAASKRNERERTKRERIISTGKSPSAVHVVSSEDTNTIKKTDNTVNISNKQNQCKAFKHALSLSKKSTPSSTKNSPAKSAIAGAVNNRGKESMSTNIKVNATNTKITGTTNPHVDILVELVAQLVVIAGILISWILDCVAEYNGTRKKDEVSAQDSENRIITRTNAALAAPIRMLVLATSFFALVGKHVLAEVMENHENVTVYYLLMYIMPYLGDVLMNMNGIIIPMPHFAPHVVSFLTMLKLCSMPGISNEDGDDNGIDAEKMQEKNHERDAQEETCHRILIILRWILSLLFFFDGASSGDNFCIMNWSSSSRLMVAYVLFLVKQSSTPITTTKPFWSPIAWISWSVQMLLSQSSLSLYRSYSKLLLDPTIFAIGLASIRVIRFIDEECEQENSQQKRTAGNNLESASGSI